MQREVITRASTQRGDSIAEGLWFEEKATARTSARPVLERVRQLVREGSIKRLYVYRFDRVVRSGVRDAIYLVDEFRRCGCELVTLADPVFQFDGPIGDIVLSVVAGFAQIELQINAERRDAARSRIIAAGGTWGRPKSITHETEARVRELRAQKRSVRAISVALKISRAAVGRIVRRLKTSPPNHTARQAKKTARRSSVPPPSH